MDDLDLRDLATLAVVARHRNFRRAATELGLSVSSVSQRLRDFEARLGVRLLNRTTRSVAPTEAGARFLAQVAPALRGVADALGEVRRQSDVPSGRLRLNAPAPAAHLALAPMVAAFLMRYPAVDFEIVVEPALIDIVDAGYDAGIRYDEDLALDMIAVPLGGAIRYSVVGAPAYFENHPRPTHPRDLAHHICLAIRFPNHKMPAWTFEKDGNLIEIMPSGPLTSNDSAILLRAAMDGLGLFSTFEDYAREAVAAGSLVSVLDDWCATFTGPYLYYPSRRQPPAALAALAAFVGFLTEWRRAQPSI